MVTAERLAEDVLTDREASIRRAFHVAVLLTANAKRAEQVVIDCLESAEWEELLTDRFLDSVVAAVVNSNRPAPSERLGEVSMPVELQQVLRLPETLRYCFVLRVLLGKSIGDIARLLGMDKEAVLESTCQAICALTATRPSALLHGERFGQADAAAS